MKKQTEALARFKKATDIMPAADVTRALIQLVELRKEQAITQRELAKTSAARDVAVAEIGAKYTLLHKVFDRLFEERRDAINKHFEIIDRGIQHNDRELVLGGLKGLGDVVASSPFANAAELGKLLESGGRIEY